MPDGHPLERAGIRTDARLRPVDAAGEVVLDNVVVAGSLLAGQRYLAERCGDGVAIASGFRAAATLAAARPGPTPRRRRPAARCRAAGSAPMTIHDLVAEAAELVHVRSACRPTTA